ncbi:hypothetical protein [Pseudonocardia alaniniphila]|uniref:S-adenosyl methyltransferase n=1 Tax=Pseudonocardia alaniniphila TaxID=75291 RepID=A0ABS9T9Q8_9PSEU|nr:hypothetical protein [Pseudonocardia alaniniphila]MCH6165158.1 hypothetical protein [Pseudonocardia alaniniphila]
MVGVDLDLELWHKTSRLLVGLPSDRHPAMLIEIRPDLIKQASAVSAVA